VLHAWVLFHNGEFQQAWKPGCKAGGGGITVANKATCIYANYLEKKEKARLDLFLDAAQRAEAQAAPSPERRTPGTGRPTRWAATARASAWPRRWRKGLGSKVKDALERAIRCSPACRCPHRARRLPCRSDRQGRHADRRHDLRRQEGIGLKMFQQA
jgi:hypothetical protein